MPNRVTAVIAGSARRSVNFWMRQSSTCSSWLPLGNSGADASTSTGVDWLSLPPPAAAVAAAIPAQQGKDTHEPIATFARGH